MKKIAVNKLSISSTGRKFSGKALKASSLIAGLCLTVLTTTASAGHRFPVVSVLFSPNNDSVMATVAGVQGGSGVSQAQLVVLNTATGDEIRNTAINSTPAKPLTPATVLNELLRREQGLLSSSGFQIKRAPTLRYRKVFSASNPSWNEGIKVGESSVYDIRLWSKPVPIRLSVRQGNNAGCPTGSAQMPSGEGPASFVINVNGQDIYPKKVPACAARYTLERVDLSGNRIMFTVRAYSPGFEGPNADPIFVATLLR